MRKQILSVAIALPMVIASTASTFASEPVKISQLTTGPQASSELSAKRPKPSDPKDPKDPTNPSYVLTPIRFGQNQLIRFGDQPSTNLIEQPYRKRPPFHGDSVILQR